MSITLRKIRKEDNPALAAIIRSSIEEFNIPTEGTAHTDPTTNDLFQLFETPGSIYWVVEENGEILGGCGIYPTDGLPDGCAELVRFFLSAQSRGKGLGRKLIELNFACAKDMGYRQVYLESFPEMDKAISLYLKNGFTYLPVALGNSGHHSCNVWMIKEI